MEASLPSQGAGQGQSRDAHLDLSLPSSFMGHTDNGALGGREHRQPTPPTPQGSTSLASVRPCQALSLFTAQDPRGWFPFLVRAGRSGARHGSGPNLRISKCLSF